MRDDVLKQIREEMERAYRPHQENAADDLAQFESPALRSTLAALHASYALVGQLPPEPPTLRGRAGKSLIKLVSRILSWYSKQIVYFQYSALRALEEQAKLLDRAERRIRHLEDELSKQRTQNGHGRSL